MTRATGYAGGMGEAPRAPNEASRLQILHSLDILDTPPDLAFDRITSFAKRLFNCPIVLVSLVGEHRQWFKSAVGLADKETPRELAFCAHAILESKILEISDASKDPRFSDNALVTGEPWIRFYAGAPLEVSPGIRLGTLCLIDRKALALSALERAWLRTLGDVVADLLESRRRSIALLSTQRALEEDTWEVRGAGAALRCDVISCLARLDVVLATLEERAALASADALAVATARSLGKEAKSVVESVASLLELPAVPASELEQVDVARMLEGITQTLSPARDINVLLDIQPVYSHAASLREVFEALVDNAFRHASSRVSIQGRSIDGWWAASVINDGPGVEVDEVGDPLAACVGTDGRSGMGLTRARRLIRMLGGRLWIETEQIGGTVVMFEVPQFQR